MIKNSHIIIRGKNLMNMRLMLLSALSLVLFGGGIMLLLSGIAFWGALLGVPAIIIGIALIMLSFDKLEQPRWDEEKEY